MFRICIDPGHGEYGNPYPQRPGYYEGTQMYKLAQYQKEELEKYSDVEVILTRKTITDDPSLDARGKMAAGCDLFYSDHSNAADSSGNWSAARGVDIYGSNRKPSGGFVQPAGRGHRRRHGQQLPRYLLPGLPDRAHLLRTTARNARLLRCNSFGGGHLL